MYFLTSMSADTNLPKCKALSAPGLKEAYASVDAPLPTKRPAENATSGNDDSLSKNKIKRIKLKAKRQA